MNRRQAGRINPAQLLLFTATSAPDAARSDGPLATAGATVPAVIEAPAATLDDEAVLAGLREGRGEALRGLLEEAAQRRLVAAVPAVMALARVYEPEPQIAALQTLAAIGGPEAARAVTALMTSRAVTWPAQLVGVVAAAALGCRLPASALQPLSRAGDPAVRLALCQCLKGGEDSVSLLGILVQDAAHEVALVAARALALRGLPAGVAALVAALRRAPTPADVDAVAVIADETLMVELGKTARAHPALAPYILDTLDGMDLPRASLIATALRRDVA